MEHKYSKIKDNPDFVKDSSTGAVINVNRTKLERARAIKRRREEEKERIEKLESTVAFLLKELKKNREE